MTRTLVIVGHGMTGHRLADRLRTLDAVGEWHVLIFAEERRPAYNRLALSSYLDGCGEAELTLADGHFLRDPRVELHLASAVVSVDRQARTVVTADGKAARYDALVLATGSRPFVPPVPGRDIRHCFVYRTLEDLDAIRAAARVDRPGVVIGGGLLGLEAAYALHRLGMRPRVVETAPHLMPAQLDAGAAEVLHRHAAELGFSLHCGIAVSEVHARPDGTVGAITLADATTWEADLVVFAAGIRPRDELAAALGLERGERGGFLVDEYCRTVDPHVYAVGECAAVHGRCYGLVRPGYAMADMVARQLAGRAAEPFDHTDDSTALKLLGVQVATFGATRFSGDQPIEVTFAEGANRYAKILLSRGTGIVLGGILAGDTGSRAQLGGLVGHRPTSDLEQLLLP